MMFSRDLIAFRFSVTVLSDEKTSLSTESFWATATASESFWLVSRSVFCPPVQDASSNSAKRYKIFFITLMD